MAPEKKPHILVIPFPQSGHMLPHLDLTHQILRRGSTVTVVVTPKNQPLLRPLLSLHSPAFLKTLILPFPHHPSIPAGVESLDRLSIHFLPHMLSALYGLHRPLADWLRRQKIPGGELPDVVLGSSFLSPWINELANEFSLKSITFLPINAHSISVMWAKENRGFFEDLEASTTASYGLVVNTFDDLEPEYVEIVKTRFVTHHRVWTVGPLIPIKTAGGGGVGRGGPSSVPTEKVTAWLDSWPEDNSVVYVGFGSQIRLTKPQTAALAAALEKSGVRFIWAVGDAAENTVGGGGDGDDVIPAGFEERVAERGLIIRGWAPQWVILEHRVVGSYLTHLGWGSVMEAMIGGVLLLAWPMQADHFYNATLLVNNLRAAVRVGENRDSVPDPEELARVLAESVSVNLPERVEFLRLREKGLNAVKEGGSSFRNLDELATEMSR